jgi:hypothetical protein
MGPLSEAESAPAGRAPRAPTAAATMKTGTAHIAASHRRRERAVPMILHSSLWTPTGLCKEHRLAVRGTRSRRADPGIWPLARTGRSEVPATRGAGGRSRHVVRRAHGRAVVGPRSRYARPTWSPLAARNAAQSSRRELIPSFAYTLRRCHSTVRELRKSCAPISGFERPSSASRTI